MLVEALRTPAIFVEKAGAALKCKLNLKFYNFKIQFLTTN